MFEIKPDTYKTTKNTQTSLDLINRNDDMPYRFSTCAALYGTGPHRMGPGPVPKNLKLVHSAWRQRLHANNYYWQAASINWQSALLNHQIQHLKTTWLLFIIVTISRNSKRVAEVFLGKQILEKISVSSLPLLFQPYFKVLYTPVGSYLLKSK